MENQDNTDTQDNTPQTEGTEVQMTKEPVGEVPPAPAPQVTSELPFVGGVSIRKGEDGSYLVVPDEVEVESKSAPTLEGAAELAKDYLLTLEN